MVEAWNGLRLLLTRFSRKSTSKKLSAELSFTNTPRKDCSPLQGCRECRSSELHTLGEREREGKRADAKTLEARGR